MSINLGEPVVLTSDEAHHLRDFIAGLINAQDHIRNVAGQLTQLADDARHLLTVLEQNPPTAAPAPNPTPTVRPPQVPRATVDGTGPAQPLTSWPWPPKAQSRRIEWDPSGVVGYRIIDDRQAAGLACVDCGLETGTMLPVGRCDDVQVFSHCAHEDALSHSQSATPACLTDRLTSPLGDTREHPVLCSSCYRNMTANIAGICDACQDSAA